MNISKKVQKIRASGIREIFEAKEKNKTLLDFSLGQPDFDVPVKIKRAAIQAITNGKNKYTENQGILELREAIEKKLKTRNHINAKEENIVVTTGATGGLVLSLFAVLNPGDEVIVPDPFFPLYAEIPKLMGGKVRFLDTYPDFTLKLEKLVKLINHKTKVIIINTPNAPTGSVYEQSVLAKLAKIAAYHHITIICDEIYEDFIYDDHKHFSIGSIYPNTITLNGLSKSFGMPGWRIGYLHAPRQLIPEMIKLQQLFYCCAPTPAQYAAIQALKMGGNESLKIKKAYLQKRNLVYQGLKDYFNFKKPLGSFYCFIEVPDGNGSEFSKIALKSGVAVVPGNVFSQKNTHFRLAYCTDDQIIKKGITKIVNIKKLLPHKK